MLYKKTKLTNTIKFFNNSISENIIYYLYDNRNRGEWVNIEEFHNLVKESYEKLNKILLNMVDNEVILKKDNSYHLDYVLIDFMEKKLEQMEFSVSSFDEILKRLFALSEELIQTNDEIVKNQLLNSIGIELNKFNFIFSSSITNIRKSIQKVKFQTTFEMKKIELKIYRTHFYNFQKLLEELNLYIQKYESYLGRFLDDNIDESLKSITNSKSSIYYELLSIISEVTNYITQIEQDQEIYKNIEKFNSFYSRKKNKIIDKYLDYFNNTTPVKITTNLNSSIIEKEEFGENLSNILGQKINSLIDDTPIDNDDLNETPIKVKLPPNKDKLRIEFEAQGDITLLDFLLHHPYFKDKLQKDNEEIINQFLSTYINVVDFSKYYIDETKIDKFLKWSFPQIKKLR